MIELLSLLVGYAAGLALGIAMIEIFRQKF
jgi:hypothetical protein